MQQTDPDHHEFSVLATALRIAVTLYIALAMYSSFTDSISLWGVYHLTYIGTWAASALSVLGMILTWWGAVCESLLGWLSAGVTRIRQRPILATIASLFIGAVFVVGRSRNHILGDGYTILENASNPYFVLPTEAVDLLTHHCVYLITGSTLFSYAAVSAAMGLLFLAVGWVYSCRLASSTEGAVTCFLILFGLAQVQFFFGYAESYTMMTVAMAFFLYFGWRYVSENSRFWFATLAFLLSGLCHLSGWFTLPGLLYLFWLRDKRDGKKVFRAAAIAVAILAMVTATLFYAKLEGGQIFVPTTATTMSPYSLLSGWHLKDIGNLLLLVAPLPLLVVLLSALSRAIRSDLRTPATLFLAMSSIGTFMFSFAVDPKMGAFRDWDLLALFGVPSAFIAVNIVRKPLTDGRSRASLAGAALALIVVHTIPWVISNTMQERARTAAKELVRTDVHYTPQYYQGYRLASWGVLMAEVFGDVEEKTWAFGQRVRGNPKDQRAWVVYASSLAGIGQDSVAAKALRQVTDLDQLLDVNLRVLTDLQYRYMMFEEARKTAAYAHDRNPGEIHFISIAAGSCLMLGDFKASLEYATLGLQIDPDDLDLTIKAAAAAIGAGELSMAAGLLDRASNHPKLSEKDRADISTLDEMLQDSSEK